MANEPTLIRRTPTIEEADIIISWLSEQGIDAIVPDRDNVGALAFGITDVEGFEIVAPDAETAKRAQKLLAEHDKQRAAAATAETAGDPIEVECEECGQHHLFPPDTPGTVQVCSDCGAYLDIPGEAV